MVSTTSTPSAHTTDPAASTKSTISARPTVLPAAAPTNSTTPLTGPTPLIGLKALTGPVMSTNSVPSTQTTDPKPSVTPTTLTTYIAPTAPIDSTISTGATFTDYHFIHDLIQYLKAGSKPTSPTRRPPLPLPIIMLILLRAGYLDPKSRILARSSQELSVASSGPLRSERWFISTPIQQPIARMVLSTSSHDQGWATHNGSWSWFDVSVVSPNGRVKNRPNGEPLTWKSHSNLVASEAPVALAGTFEVDHEIWRNLANGDRIAVSIAAQFGGWANHAKEGTLRIWEWSSAAVAHEQSGKSVQ